MQKIVDIYCVRVTVELHSGGKDFLMKAEYEHMQKETFNFLCYYSSIWFVCVFTSLKGRARVAETWFEGNRSN